MSPNNELVYGALSLADSIDAFLNSVYDYPRVSKKHFSVELILFFSSQFLVSLVWAADPAQNWHLQTYGFAARYHPIVGFESGAGAGLAIERGIARNWFAGAAGVEYIRAAQTLKLIGGSQRAYVDLFGSYLAGRGNWRPGKQTRLSLIAELQIGLLFLHPCPLRIDTGTFGATEFRPPSEIKFAPAFGGGMRFRVTRRAAVLFFIRQSFLRVASRQIDNDAATIVWRPYWHYGAGLAWLL
jgi:hypothetical protein